MLPQSLDAERLQQLAIGILVVLVVLSVLVLRFVQKAVTKVVMLGLMVGLGVAVWVQREELRQCGETCDCQLFGQDVHVPKVGCDTQLGS